jgi:hypothetical protein
MITTEAGVRPVTLKSAARGGLKAFLAASAFVGARPIAPIVANMTPAPPLIPTERKKLLRVKTDLFISVTRYGLHPLPAPDFDGAHGDHDRILLLMFASAVK